MPLRPDLTERLRPWLAAKDGKLWPDTWWRNAAEMLRGDLDLAKIPYEDTAGRVADFHALRCLYIGTLLESGASPKVAQTLARHSSVNLTMSYAKLRDG